MTDRGLERELRLTALADDAIMMTRAFAAPRARVFAAFTEPDLIRRWLLGPDGWSMPICSVDLVAGGRYRYVWRNNADGSEFGVSGAFREIVRNERVVHTERFDEAWYPGEALITTTFVEHGAATIVTLEIVYESRAARDAVLASGMERGVSASYDRLAGLLPVPSGRAT